MLRLALAIAIAGLVPPPSISLGRSSIAQSEEPRIRTPDFHGWDPLGADSPWFREFKRDISALPADPHSAQMLARLVRGNGKIDPQWSGSWTPAAWNWYTVPFQVVSGSVPPVRVPGKWSYDPASEGPYMLPPEPVVTESSHTLTYAEKPWADGQDHHVFVYVRDESTGGFKELWEYYQPWVVRSGAGITAVNGASWRRFDLRNGENPAADTPSTDAAGMPFMPLVVRYDEVARGAINHALRFCVNNSDIAPTYKWPARTSAAAWNAETGMPYGTRLRIRQDWWRANADRVLGVGTQARVIGEALRRYGCILADGSGGTSIQLIGVADMRWQRDLHDRLSSIPASALEVVATPPMLQIVGPASLKVGETGEWQLTFLPSTSPVGEGSSINILDRNGRLVAYRMAAIDSSHRHVAMRYRFDRPGIYSIKPYASWNTGFGPFRVTVRE